MPHRIVTISLTTKGAQLFRESLQNNDYINATPTCFNPGMQLWHSKQIIAENKNGIIIRFDKFENGIHDVLAIHDALNMLKNKNRPYQIITQLDDKIVYAAYNRCQIDIHIPSERLPFDISKPNYDETGETMNLYVDIALKQMPTDSALNATDIAELLSEIDDNQFEPITIEAKTHECSAMGFASNKVMADIDYNIDEIADFVANILDDIINENETGIYECVVNNNDHPIRIALRY